MKLGVVCCTFLRPHLLGELIDSFLRQTYPPALRQLIILDDMGQYAEQKGEGWRLVSHRHRYTSLGAKRNAATALLDSDCQGLVVADDDDIYLPHWLHQHAQVLQDADWSVPGTVWTMKEGYVRFVTNWGTYHAGWAYRRSMFDALGGYAALNNGEDQEFLDRARRAGYRWKDPVAAACPYLLCRQSLSHYQLSDLDDTGYRELERQAVPSGPQALRIGWNNNYQQICADAWRAHASRI